MKFALSVPDGGEFKVKTAKHDYVNVTVSHDNTSIRITLTKNEILALAERVIEHYEEEEQ
jgi:hypothetical protein